jgi:aldose 1-epimerase
MPFGIGLHPYFVRDEGARLKFRARVRFVSDSRNLPMRAIAAVDGPDFRQGVLLQDLPWFDSHYAQWEPRTAFLERPDAGLSVTISARGVFRNLHVFAPHASDFVCIEPVSHVPDVANRRPFASLGDLHFLSPGESLSGSFTMEAA